MLRIFQPDEIGPTANDLRPTIRQCLKQWQSKITEQQARLTLDLSVPLPVLCQAEDTHPLIHGLLELAVKRLVPDGELSVIGCRTAGAVELEIADTGPQLPCESKQIRWLFPPRVLADSRQLAGLQPQAIAFGGRVWATPCPQGGMAWTLRLPSRATIKRAA
ncbi:MAG: hypothetical protein U0892_14650 [Pirellulales bacterium]